MTLKTNDVIFKVLLIIVWLIFVGLSIEAGGLITNFVFTLYKPEFISNLYQKLDLTEVYNDSKLVFLGLYSIILVNTLLKVVLFYVVIRMMHKLDLAKPFNRFVAKQITLISYYTLAIGIFSHLARQIAKSALHDGTVIEILNQFWDDSQAFIFMGAVIYIIATIFKKGVAIQQENDLTV